MLVLSSVGSPDDFYKLQIAKAGYRDIWLDYTPEFNNYTYQGGDYLIAHVPDMYLCRDDEVDTDGDRICDAAEERYGTSATSADTDGDGEYDDQEIFGTGSPFAVQTRKLLHYNINVSNFDTSKSFYALLGFKLVLESDVSVSDPAEAQGLDLPPYSLHAGVIFLGVLGADAFLIDLIRFESPYDPEPPHSGEALGMTKLELQTENLAADMAAFDASGTPYTVVAESEGGPLAIEPTDPDGVLIELVQMDGPVNYSANYARSVSGPTIYVSDHERSLAFYKKVGFQVSEEGEGSSSLYVSTRLSVKLVETTSEIPAYEDVNHLGIARIAIETTNIDQDIAILEAAGIEVYTSEAIDPSGPFSFLRYVGFEDPDGTVIELVEYK
jgi:catechol 2,3-dioxygenase-like lactoylglutathione lyase family enzyme